MFGKYIEFSENFNSNQQLMSKRKEIQTKTNDLIRILSQLCNTW